MSEEARFAAIDSEANKISKMIMLRLDEHSILLRGFTREFEMIDLRFRTIEDRVTEHRVLTEMKLKEQLSLGCTRKRSCPPIKGETIVLHTDVFS